MEHYSIWVIHAIFMPIILCLIEVRLVNSNCIISPLLAVCVRGVPTEDTLTLFHTRQEFKDPPNIQKIVDGGGKGVNGHAIGKKNGILRTYKDSKLYSVFNLVLSCLLYTLNFDLAVHML